MTANVEELVAGLRASVAEQVKMNTTCSFK
jgi:hypothetical protein